MSDAREVGKEKDPNYHFTRSKIKSNINFFYVI